MKNQTLVLSLLAYFLLISLSEAADPNQCYRDGYKRCLDIWGDCTKNSGSCEQSCNRDSDCFFECCYNGFCGFKSTCDNKQDKAIKIVSIVVPIVVGVIVLIIIIICCVMRKRQRTTQQQINMVAQQQHEYNQQNATTNGQYQYNQQNMNNAMQNQQMFMMQQQPQQFGGPVYVQQQMYVQPGQPGYQQQPQINYVHVQDTNLHANQQPQQNMQLQQNQGLVTYM